MFSKPGLSSLQVGMLCLVFPALLLGSMRSAPASPAISLPSIVEFNTACAHCHEGGCSGRLSFNSGAAAATEHIRRYVGDVSDTRVAELFELLNHMKKECAFFPMPTISMDSNPSTEALARYASPSGKAWFFALGALEPGTYVLALELAQPVAMRVEVIGPDFDPQLDVSDCSGLNTGTLEFPVEQAAPHYLRLRSNSPFSLSSLNITGPVTTDGQLPR